MGFSKNGRALGAEVQATGQVCFLHKSLAAGFVRGSSIVQLVPIHFVSGSEFLRHFLPGSVAGILHFPTRIELSLGEAVLVELSFPGLPNRALLRCTVREIDASLPLVRFAIDPADLTTQDVCVGIALGKLRVAPPRRRQY